MTAAADRLLVDAEVHTLTDPDSDTVHEAVAIRDGEIVRLGDTAAVEFLAGVETDVIDCEGRVVLPGFVDAHTHMEQLGQHLVHADLSSADGAAACVRSLAERADRDPDREWILGFGYDDSEWPESGPLTREDLDRVSEERPVVAMRVDLHTASLNTVALERLADDLPETDLRREGGEPTGVAVEDAAEAVRTEITADREEMRAVLAAAARDAVERGVTGVHDKVRGSVAPRVYRELAAAGDLPLRVRIDYWSDHLDALADVGLGTNHGSDRVRTGAIKSFSDGSFGSRTARLGEPYADIDGDTTDDRGQWVVDPDTLAALVERADAEGYQLCVHAIGDEAIEETLSALEATADPGASRHRIEHAELATDDQLERMAAAGIVASMQPNFHRWADADRLYDRRLGEARREQTNRFRRVLEAGVPLAFGSDCMPLDPLFGVHHAVNAPTDAQRLSVTEALRAYTVGAARAGFDDDRLGTIERGKRGDLVVLEDSPWERPERIEEIEVAMTLVDGEVVFDGREA
ncbi:amidohydrolase [Natrinema salaciae]|uniref:Amidohydrolase 3 domain-containing protein n=1 Tax=Natrinema salaciae TaxID=1186196 RepID=A0A1H9Q014_9EURY|nr:amidohydrolase [Natrinema salaciae]SER53728.1 hypothetical protein SAMN04489841_4044 [Natrinema salaciae]